MIAQTTRGFEGFITLSALKWHLIRVHNAVADKVVLCFEDPFTFTALEWLLVSVH